MSRYRTRRSVRNGCLTHDQLVELVYDRLQDRGNYAVLEHHLNYRQRGYAGEFDVLAIRGKTAHAYEVKTFDLTKSRIKFRMQCARIQKAFPEYDWTFIYVTNDGIRRFHDVS